MDPHKTACIAIILALATKRRVKRKRWMKEWLKKREQYSHILLLNEIRDTGPEDYKNYFLNRLPGLIFQGNIISLISQLALDRCRVSADDRWLTSVTCYCSIRWAKAGRLAFIWEGNRDETIDEPCKPHPSVSDVVYEL
ncbi:hypothetical protein WA026_001435 [Henosepilachna vigintioctopunctata]|uniref:Uncharacterized protein n=1 Tax=Henosepilachna vigintioctopunctata TaxID=420089 RepID=A0AAW1UTU1_9CUCU